MTNGLHEPRHAAGGPLPVDGHDRPGVCPLGTTGLHEPAGPEHQGPQGPGAGREKAQAILGQRSAGTPDHSRAVFLTVPYPVSANRYWASRAFTPAGGGAARAVTYVTAEAKAFKESVAWLTRHAGVRQPMAGRVQVEIFLLPHRPKDWETRARRDPLWWADSVARLDLDNCRKVINDALKGVVFADDKFIWRDYGEILEPDGRDACLFVLVTPLVKRNPQAGLL